MADTSQQYSLGRVPDPCQDDPPMQRCWAWVMPPGSGDAAPCNTRGMGDMAGIGNCMGPEGADGTDGTSVRTYPWGMPSHFFMKELIAGQASSS